MDKYKEEAVRQFRHNNKNGFVLGYDIALMDQYVESLTAENEAKQAKIDALMLEHCPNEMTPEQIKKWRECQALPSNGGEHE